MEKYICIHGHFYQPPRENPWLEEIEAQDGAYPYHDWNEKITAECYAPNASSRILNTDGKIIDIVNTYSKISFDFGPTLLSWMERNNPEVYQSIIEADRMSVERFSGHGSAVAHAYNHMILPLANERDKYTQVIWGVRDFEKRFGRFPEGMWLAEAAVDTDTLEVLVEHGIKFIILAPRQAKRIRKLGGQGEWIDVSGEKVDPTRAYKCVLSSGKSISIFFYDGPVSQEISFGGLLKNGGDFARRLTSLFYDKREHPQIVHMATDGETFGHHHRHGDMALSYALHYIESKNLARVTNYGEYLEKHPPVYEAEIVENSSWSCIHGVERWRDDCGCHSGMHPKWNQSWRRPLREALDRLRDRLVSIYSDEASKYLKDPWGARNDYIDVLLDRSEKNVDSFISKHATRELSPADKINVLKLLEAQRNAMLMYTSCGWFFDEVSGIETVQIIRYASKAIQYAEESNGTSLEADFLEQLEKIPSNVYKNALELYELYVKTAKSDLLRVGAHYSISSLFEGYTEETQIYCYTAKKLGVKVTHAEEGKQRLAIGKAVIVSNITRDEKTISFAVLHLGDHNINAGVKEFCGENEFLIMKDEINDAFEEGDISKALRLMDKHFESNIFSLWHLFRDEQRKVLDMIFELTYESVDASYRHIYEDNYAIMGFYQNLQRRVPRSFRLAARYLLNNDLKKAFNETDLGIEKVKKLIDDIQKWSIKVDDTTVGYVAGKWITGTMERLNEEPEDILLIEKINDVIEASTPLALPLDLWKAQNIYFSIGRNLHGSMEEKAGKNESAAKEWLEAFLRLGHYLQVKI
jgi:alpha-amylase/alpha-mannosidase (GH57 family)